MRGYIIDKPSQDQTYNDIGEVGKNYNGYLPHCKNVFFSRGKSMGSHFCAIAELSFRQYQDCVESIKSICSSIKLQDIEEHETVGINF